MGNKFLKFDVVLFTFSSVFCRFVAFSALVKERKQAVWAMFMHLVIVAFLEVLRVFSVRA